MKFKTNKDNSVCFTVFSNHGRGICNDIGPLPSCSGSSYVRQQCCVLDRLLSTDTSCGALCFQEKQDIIVKGRPTPDISMSTNMKNYVRYFKMQYYKSSKWLTACKSKKKLFCWPCVLFVSDRGVWNSSGFSDMSNFHKAKIRHEKTQSHLFAITKLKTFGKTRIDFQLSEQRRTDVLKHNAEVDSNREIMKRLIDLTCLLARQELPFRGHKEDNESLNRGNYIEILQFLSKYDVKLDTHLQSAKIFKGTSNRIQNDIIESISAVTLDTIREEVKDASYVALMLDETTDVAKLSQLSTVIRYVKEGEIQERFLGFTDVSSDRSAVALSEHVFKILSDFQCENKLVSQGYDGAATFSGHINGVQALVKKKCPNAFFVHCYAHRLNLVLSQSVQFIKECKIFFKTLSGFCSFFSHSTKRVNALNESEVKKRFPSVSVTRWNYNSRIVNTVHENKTELISFFEHIVDDPDSWDTDTYNCAVGYLTTMKSFTFSFLLEIFSLIFALTDTLFNILQTKTFDVNYCVAKVKETISFIQEYRNNFDDIYATLEESNTNENEPKKRRREGELNDPRMRHLRLYNEIIDTVLSQMETRFRDLEELKFIELIDSKKFETFKTRFPENLFTSLKSGYNNLFQFEKLRSELVAVYRLSDFSGKKVTEIAKFLKDTELGEEAFPEVYKLCCLIATIPVSTSTVERTFSCLKRVKSYVRNTQCEDRLSRLSLLSIEKALLNKLQSQRHFYDDVIEKFARKEERRIPLVYK